MVVVVASSSQVREGKILKEGKEGRKRREEWRILKKMDGRALKEVKERSEGRKGGH